MDEGVVQGGNGRRQQVRAERKDGFSAEKRQVFLDHLAGCSNVTRSAAAAGVSAVTVNYHRRRDAGFAQGCAEALAAGYLALEAMMLERAATGGGYAPGEGAGAGAVPGPESLDVGLGQFLMGLRAREMGQRTGRASGPRPQRATEKELNEAILGKLALLDASLRSGRSKLSGGKRSGGKPSGGERK